MLDLLLDRSVYAAMEKGKRNYYQLSGELIVTASMKNLGVINRVQEFH